MRRIIGTLVMSLVVGTGAFAQTIPSFGAVQQGFQDFAGDVASSLPFASSMGLNWSWAYIGNLPHFGLGLAAGAITIPTTGFDKVTSALGIPNALPPQLNDPNLGLPIPAYDAELRIGGIFAPFDVGIKAGFIPPQANLGAILPAGTTLDFHLYGIQVRYALVKEKFLIPAVSVGVGVNHFDATLGTTVGSNMQIASVPISQTQSYNIAMSAPQLFFHWDSNSIDATIQVSKKILLIVTPYVGAGLSYGISQAGGGINSQLLINGNPATTAQLDQINQYLKLTNQSTINFTSSGFKILSQANGFGVRAFGGVSVNIAFLKVDATLMYNLLTQKVGATVGTRLQF